VRAFRISQRYRRCIRSFTISRPIIWVIVVQHLGTAWWSLLQESNIQLSIGIWPPHCPEKSGTNRPVTPRNIPEEQKTQLLWRIRLRHRQEILTRKAEGLSGSLRDVAIYQTILFHNPKDHHVVSMRSHVHHESKRERSENERWEFLTSHVCRHFCKHTRCVKPVYWRTCNVHEPYKIKSMKRRHIETSNMFSMLSTSKEVSEFSLCLNVFFFFYLPTGVYNDFNAGVQ